MNNSSAYNNLLLKSIQAPAAPASATSAPKRNDRDDEPSANFRQRFNDVHDTLRPHDEKIAKPAAAKKTAQVDNRTPANDVEKKSPAPAKQADKSSSRDSVSKNETTTDNNEQPATQNADEQSTVVNDSEGKSIAKKTCVDEEPATDDSLAESMLVANANVPAPLPVVAPTEVAIAPVPAPIPVAVETDVQAEVTTDISSGIKPDPLAVIDPNTAIVETTKGDASSLINKQTKTDKPELNTDGETIATAADTSTLIAPQLVTDTLLPQAPTTSAATPDAAAEQATAVLAALGSSVLPKTTSAQTTLAPVEDSTTDADTLSTLASPLAAEKSSVKADVVNDLALAAKTDITPAQAQVLDAKSTFDKTLQNLIHPQASTREEGAVVPAAAQTSTLSSSTSSSTNTLDSMLRFNDAQTPAARSFVVQTAVPVAVGQPQWSQAVGEKVLWLAAQNVSSAEIHLNPENLGPVQVKVSVNQEQTTINFTSHHAVVREVLDQNLGRLRDMFSEQGLNLVNVDVSDKSFSRQQGDAKDQKGQAGTNDTHVEDEAPVAMSLIKQQRLVDHYA